MSTRTLSFAAIICFTSLSANAETPATHVEFQFQNVATETAILSCGQMGSHNVYVACNKNAKTLTCNIDLPNSKEWRCVLSLDSGTWLPKRVDGDQCSMGTVRASISHGGQLSRAQFYAVPDGAYCEYVMNVFAINNC